MTKECFYCGFKEPMPFTCKFCGGTYCYSHRLPESHNCSGLTAYKARAIETGIIYKPDIVIGKKQNPVLRNLKHIASVITSNYSLTILILCLISFVIQLINPRYTYDFELVPSDIFTRPWILITHMFLHDPTNGLHILFNMMVLFFFGPELERRIGGKKFLAVYFISGLVAALGYSFWTLFVLGSNGPAIGASGALMGIFACLAVLAPDIVVYIYFIPTKITYALIFFVLLDLFLSSSGDLVAHSAHLSGVVAGLVMGRYLKKTGKFLR
ncbi:MAG TPA: rhomboid family intramembrane serine protease [Candidatus Methanoperedens sp.]